MIYIWFIFCYLVFLKNKIGYVKVDYEGVILIFCVGCGYDFISVVIV